MMWLCVKLASLPHNSVFSAPACHLGLLYPGQPKCECIWQKETENLTLFIPFYCLITGIGLFTTPFLHTTVIIIKLKLGLLYLWQVLFHDLMFILIQLFVLIPLGKSILHQLFNLRFFKTIFGAMDPKLPVFVHYVNFLVLHPPQT